MSNLSSQGTKALQAVSKLGVLVRILGKECAHGVPCPQGLVKLRVRAGFIRPDADQILRARIDGHKPAQQGCMGAMLRPGDGWHEAAD
jgi:hypothetical protein